MSNDSIRRTLDEYYERFAEDDWPSIVRMYELPAMLIVGERRLVLDSPDAVTDLYQKLRAKFTHEGVAGLSWDRDSLNLFSVHDDLTVARVAVTRFGKSGAPVKTWTCSYALRRSAHVWRINLVTSDELPVDQRQSAGSPLPR